MGALINIYFKAEVLKELAKTTEKGIALTIAINDETNTYDQNVSAHVAQTKEQRKNKEKKAYVANGSVVWTDGKIVVAKKKEESGDKIMDGIELPF